MGDWEDRTFLVRHWENFSGVTLGELRRSDTGRTAKVRHWGETRLSDQTHWEIGETRLQVRYWEVGETRLSGQTLREGWRQDFQVRH